MGIRYTKAYNNELRSAVRHFNSVRKTLSKRGIKLTPAPLKVSDLKSRYNTRKDLNKEIAILNSVSSKSDKLLKEVETSGGATAIKWEFDYLKQNTRNAIEHFKWERELELKKNPVYPHERERLNEIDENLNYLQMEVDYMNQDQFNAYKGAVTEYFQMVEHMKRGYRGFLYQAERAMRIVGVGEAEINSFFNELKQLTPAEFHELYENSDLIKRIYEIVPSPDNGGNKLNTTMEDATDLVYALLGSIKSDIANIKANR